jgi:hypothetical protein
MKKVKKQVKRGGKKTHEVVYTNWPKNRGESSSHKVLVQVTRKQIGTVY